MSIFSRVASLVSVLAIALTANAQTLRSPDADDEPPPTRGGSLGKKAPTTTPLDIPLFLAHVQSIQFDEVVGYAMVVGKDGAYAGSSTYGKARVGDDGDEDWTIHHRMQVASVSKHLTAIAVQKVMDELGLDPDTLVAPWLPASWNVEAGWDSLTFGDLMAHTSGINQMLAGLSEDQLDPFGNDWAGLEYIATNFAIAPGSSSSYKNANFALLKILGPTLWAAKPGSPVAGWPVNDITYGPLFDAFMATYVFAPVGIDAECQPVDGVPGALLYNGDDLSIPGAASSYYNGGCWAHSGWHLSANELAAILAFEHHDDSYFSPALRFQMAQGKYGWQSGSNNQANSRTAGKFWHGGTIYAGSGRTGRSCVMRFPGGIEAALLVNSERADEKSPCSVLLDAYQDAYAGEPAPPLPSAYDDCPDPTDPSLFGTLGCPCADLDVFSSEDAAFDGGFADGSGSHLANGLYGEGQYCVGANTVCASVRFNNADYPRCETCGDGSNIGCACDSDADCQGAEPDLACWGLEANGWGDNDGGQCLPTSGTPSGRERLEEMPWFCLDNCDAIDAYADGVVACVYNQTSLNFAHGECVSFLDTCPGMQPGECEEGGQSCNFEDVCQDECVNHTDCAQQGFPDWYLCDAQGDVTFTPGHCVPPECVNQNSAYCALYR